MKDRTAGRDARSGVLIVKDQGVIVSVLATGDNGTPEEVMAFSDGILSPKIEPWIRCEDSAPTEEHVCLTLEQVWYCKDRTSTPQLVHYQDVARLKTGYWKRTGLEMPYTPEELDENPSQDQLIHRTIT